MLHKKGGFMDEKQQAAWEIVQKLNALSILIDHYSELEEFHKRNVRNESLDFVTVEAKEMRINEGDFNSLLRLFKEATKFILERELVLQKYQQNLDSKNLLGNDPIFQKLSSMLTRIRVLDTEKEALAKRNKELEMGCHSVANAHEEIKQLKYTIKERDLEINVG
jgi:hypothetical protein